MPAGLDAVTALLAATASLLRVSESAVDLIRRRLASGDVAAVDDARRLAEAIDTLTGQIQDAVRASDPGGSVADDTPVRSLSWIGVEASGEGDLAERSEDVLREEWR